MERNWKSVPTGNISVLQSVIITYASKGFLNLAHAKYTMSARTVSHYSYDERMKAILQV